MERPSASTITHLSWGPNHETRCGARLIKYVSPLPAASRDYVTCPDCLALTEEPEAGPQWPGATRPPQMGDGVFIFYDQHVQDFEMEVVPQTTGNVEITIADHFFTLSHLDRADLIRALLHDFHYSPEQGGPGDG